MKKNERVKRGNKIKKWLSCLTAACMVFSSVITASASAENSALKSRLLARGLSEENIASFYNGGWTLEEAAGMSDAKLRSIFGNMYGKTRPTLRADVRVTNIPRDGGGTRSATFASGSEMVAGDFYNDNDGSYKMYHTNLFANKAFPGEDTNRYYHLYGEKTSFGYHKGVDLVAAGGAPVPVYSNHTGFASLGKNYGVVSVWDGHFSYMYAHMKDRSTGEVTPRTRLGFQSNVSLQDIEPHLHFEVRNKNTTSMNTQDTTDFSSNKIPYHYMNNMDAPGWERKIEGNEAETSAR